MKKVIALLTIIELILTLILPVKAWAIADAAGWAIFGRQATQMGKTAEEADQQYKQLMHQYEQLQTQYKAITGNYGWGNWNNTLSALKNGREWAPSDWHSALEGMAGGNPARYEQLLDQYKAAHQAMSESDYKNGSDKNLAQSYQNQVKTNQTSATQASYEFNDINKHLQTLYQLGQQIENATQNKNIKSAIDLNSRIELEVAYITIEELRMQTVLNEQEAQLQSSKIAMESEGAEYNQAGENS